MQDTLFDESGVGAHLGGEDNPVSQRTLQRWRQEGSGPEFIRVGRQIRYRESSLDAFLKSRSFNSTSEADESAASLRLHPFGAGHDG